MIIYIEIINFFCYPKPHILKPIFVVEFVRFQSKGIVALIDMCPVIEEVLKNACTKNILQNIRKQNAQLSYCIDYPEWYEECRSGNDLYIRPQSSEEFFIFNKIVIQAWQGYHQLPSTAVRSTMLMEKHRNAIRHYKEHHNINSPGRKMLDKAFTESWTDKFLNQFQFV